MLGLKLNHVSKRGHRTSEAKVPAPPFVNRDETGSKNNFIMIIIFFYDFVNGIIKTVSKIKIYAN